MGVDGMGVDCRCSLSKVGSLGGVHSLATFFHLYLDGCHALVVACCLDFKHTVKPELTTTSKKTNKNKKRPPFWSPNFDLHNINLLLNNDHLSTTATNFGSQGWSLCTGLTVLLKYFLRLEKKSHNYRTDSEIRETALSHPLNSLSTLGFFPIFSALKRGYLKIKINKICRFFQFILSKVCSRFLKFKFY